LHILEVSSVLIFPFAGTLFYFRYKNLEREYDQVMSVSNQQSSMDKMLMLKGDYKKDEIGLKPKDIVYMLTEDNYVGLNYLDGEVLKTYLIRSTLSKMEQSLNSEYFIRCHRSYLINLKQVESYQKKQGRISIKLYKCNDLIPVSRSAEKALLDKLSEVK
jgi:DNA-binding LytR/AlgR family response regulator